MKQAATVKRRTPPHSARNNSDTRRIPRSSTEGLGSTYSVGGPTPRRAAHPFSHPCATRLFCQAKERVSPSKAQERCASPESHVLAFCFREGIPRLAHERHNTFRNPSAVPEPKLSSPPWAPTTSVEKRCLVGSTTSLSPQKRERAISAEIVAGLMSHSQNC